MVSEVFNNELHEFNEFMKIGLVDVDGIHRFSEKEEYFDNYVNWTQNR